MNGKEKKLYEIIPCGGREFRIYWEYDASQEKTLPDFPDFRESPEYTGEGRPYKQQVYESCPYAQDNEGQDPGDCGGCKWFHRDTPYAPIGICMCEEMRNLSIDKEDE